MSDHLDIHYEMVVEAITNNQVIPFLGPGANLCGRPQELTWNCPPYEYLPSHSELAERLSIQCCFPHDDNRSLLRVSQYMAVMQGAEVLYFLLHKLFDGNYRTTPVHKFLATLPAALRAKGYLHPMSVETPDAVLEEKELQHNHLIRLRQIFTTRFDEGEMRDLCFDLENVDYDNLPGEGKANKARELVSYLERRDRIPELIATGRRLRPDVPWPEWLPRREDLLRRQFLIVTTNYDDSLERAFQAADEPFHLVSYVAEGEQCGKFLHWPPDGGARLIAQPNDYDGLLFARCPIILKIHGTVNRVNAERDSFVITEDHYIDYLTQAEPASLIPVPLPAKLRNSKLLFLGYGLRDWNLRVIMRRIWQGRRLEKKSWAVQLNPDELDREFWMKRDVHIIDMCLEDYVAALSEWVQALPPAEAHYEP